MDIDPTSAVKTAPIVESLVKLASTLSSNVYNRIRVATKSDYDTYITNTKKHYSKTKSFFIRDKAVSLSSYYVPIGVKSRSESIEEPKFALLLNRSNRIIIKGSGGSGKSILMRHLFLDCIKKKKYLPVLIELRNLNHEPCSLDSIIQKTLESFSLSLPQKFIDLAKSKGHFAFFLDGFDEVNHSARENLIKDLQINSKKYTTCPFIVSTRPEDQLNELEEFQPMSIMPLSLDRACQLIRKLEYDEAVKEKFLKNLREKAFNKQHSFLSNPLLLSIMLLTYGENADIPSKISLFYQRAYEALYHKHDAYKGYKRSRLTTLDIQDFAKAFSALSLVTYDKSIFKASRQECIAFIDSAKKISELEFNSENYLCDLISSVCLLVEDGLDVAYAHRSFQEYFVASYILHAAPEAQTKLLSRFFRRGVTDNIFILLYEMNQELVEREVIIPTLEYLFSSIGVDAEVEIKNVELYLRSYYSEIVISKNGYGFSVPAGGIETTKLMVVERITKTMNFNSDKNTESISIIRNNYIANGESVRFDTNGCSYSHPFFRDIINSGATPFSKAYLENAFKYYRATKKKHEDYKESLDSLLGIT